MADLSILMPSRNEMFLARTIQDILANIRGDTEIIAVCDGAWADPQIPDHARVKLVYLPTSIGQRAATNLAAQMSTATYVMKLDAHTAVDEGFDLKLMTAAAELGADVTQIPAMYNLHAFDWRCTACGEQTYQGPTPTVVCVKRPRTEGRKLSPAALAANCQSTAFERTEIWQPRMRRRTEFWRFDSELHFQYWDDYKRRPEAQGELVDVMSSVGACFFMRRDRFLALGGLDETHGSWGQFGTEIACKSWLSGGRHIVNRRTWFAHLFRTQGGDFGFPYHQPESQVQHARAHSKRLWIKGQWPGAVRSLSWLLEKFAPVPDWTDAQRQAIRPIGRAA